VGDKGREAGGRHCGTGVVRDEGPWVDYVTLTRDPTAALDGSIFVSVMSGNKVARFDPRAQTFREWDMPSGHRPR